jgi:hypothetical protein
MKEKTEISNKEKKNGRKKQQTGKEKQDTWDIKVKK